MCEETRGEKGKDFWGIFGTQTFGSQNLPPSLFLKQAYSNSLRGAMRPYIVCRQSNRQMCTEYQFVQLHAVSGVGYLFFLMTRNERK